MKKEVGRNKVTCSPKKTRKLVEEEKYFKQIITNSKEAIIAKDLDGKILSWNSGAERVYGYKASEVLGKNIKIIFPKNNLSELRGILEKIKAGQSILDYETIRVRKDGREINILLTISPIKNESGKIIGASVIGQDITTRKEYEKELKESETELNEAQRIGNFGNFDWDARTDKIIWSEEYYRIYGFDSKKDPPGYLEHLKTYSKESAERLDAAVKRSMKTGEPYEVDLEQINSDGATRKWITARGEVKRDEQGKIIGLRGTAQDITERKKIEEENFAKYNFIKNLDKINLAIHGNNDLNKMMEDTLNVVLSMFNCDRVWLLYPCDPNASSFHVSMEVSKPEYPGAKVFNVDVPISSSDAKDMKEALSSEEPVTYIQGTKRPINKSASKFGVLSQMFTPLYPKLGKPWIFGMHQCSFIRVWTDEEKMLFKEIARRLSDGLTSLIIHNNLKESEEKYFTTVSFVEALFYDYNVLLGKLSWKGNIKEITGFEEKDFCKDISDWEKRIHPEDREKIMKELNRCKKSKEKYSVEYRFKIKSEKYIWVEDIGKFVYDSKNNPYQMLGLIRDITLRKQSEIALHDSEEKFAAAFQSSPASITITRVSDGKFLEVNEGYSKLFGYSREESIGKTVVDLSIFKNIEDRAKLVYSMNKYGYITNFEVQLRRKDGKILDIVNFAKKIKLQGEECILSVIYDITERKKIEEKLKINSLYVRSLIEADLDPLVTIGEDGKIKDVNSATEKVTGVSREKLIGTDFNKYFTDPKKASEGYLSVFKKGQVKDYPLSMRHVSGKITEVLYNAVVFRDEKGEVQGVFAAARDITERKKVEEELKESEDKYRTVSEKANEGIVIIQDKKIVYANPALGKIYGDSVNNLLNHNFLDYIFPSEKIRIKEYYRKRFVGEKISSKSETILLNKKGQKVYVELNANIVLYKGNPADLVLIRDITEHKKIEEDLKLSEKKFRDIFNVTNDSIFIHNLGGKILEVNNAACEKLNYSKKELISLSPEKVDSPEFVKFIPLRIKEVIKRGSFLFESAHITKEGKKIPVEVNAKFIEFNGEKAIISICRDITERKKIEEKLRDSEERFHTLFESANDAIWLMDGDKFIECNYQSVKLFKCKNKQDMVNHTPMDFSPQFQPDGQSSKKKALEYILSAFNGHPQRFYWKHQAKDGTLIDVEISLNSVLINNRKYIQAVGRDITERVLVEDKLRKAKEDVDRLVEERTAELNKQKIFLDLVLKNIPDMVFVKDAKTLKFNLFNDAGEKLLGQKRETLLGKSDYDLFPKEQADFFIKKDREVLDEKKLLDIPEEPIKTPRGERILHTKKIPIYDDKGKPEYLLGISDDITEQKQAEAAKAQFFSNISHELRTPITPIRSQLQRLLSKALTPEEQKESFERMMRNIMRLDRLIQDILEMTRIRSGKFNIIKKKQNFNELVENALSDLHSLIKNKKIKIIFVPKKLPLISFDRDRLLEVLINLIDNAIKYGKDVVEIEAIIKDSNLVVSVKDNGRGIPDSERDNLFVPFYRSKKSIVKKIEGTGLGLAISKEIVESHNGNIWVKSRLGHGSTFYFSIPLKK